MHPIHFLRLSTNRLILSSPDGSLCTWDLVDGKPMIEIYYCHERRRGKEYEGIQSHADEPECSLPDDDPMDEH